MFNGFTDQTTEFLWGVRFNNEREWFLAHKEIYQTQLYRPMQELAAEVQARFCAQAKLDLNVHVCRIYRDVRRLHGSGPYKDHLWFTLRTESENWAGEPCFYFELRPEGYETGMGCYAARPAFMEAYRRRVLRQPEPLCKLVRRYDRQTDFHLEGEEYKRPKAEVEPLLKPWFNRKGINLCRFRENDLRMQSPQLVDDLVADFCWLKPYYDYFQSIPAELPPETHP